MLHYIRNHAIHLDLFLAMQGLYSLIIISTLCHGGDVPFNININIVIVSGFGYLATFDIWSHRKLRRFVDLKLHTK